MRDPEGQCFDTIAGRVGSSMTARSATLRPSDSIDWITPESPYRWGIG